MSTFLVNRLTLIGATIALAACSNAQAERSETELVEQSAITPASAPSSSHAIESEQTDSITKAADLGRVQGNESAKVWVIEISDMQCPYCKDWHKSTFPKLRDEFVKTGKIRYAYINFPLSMHSNARPAARAAMCASVQGKFWSMQDAIFEAQEKWQGLADPSSFFEGLAKGVDVNVANWKSCYGSKSIQSLIEADYSRVKQQGVRSTPSFLINGRLVEGVVPIEDLRKMINTALNEPTKK